MVGWNRLSEIGASCPKNRRVKFYINCSLEYVEVEGASCPRNRWVKFYMKGRLEYI
jgi:hypothetical protein